MRMIITHENITINSDIIAMIQSVFVDISDYDVIDNINDDEHVVYEDVEFGILSLRLMTKFSSVSMLLRKNVTLQSTSLKIGSLLISATTTR